MRIGKWLLGALGVVVAILLAGLIFATAQLQIGKRRVAREVERAGPPRKLPPFGSVKRLSVLPLSDYQAGSAEFETEPGVSYLVRADDLKILFDVGLNARKAHPSPALHNMRALEMDPASIQMLFLSHIHPDHIGAGWSFAKQFSLSQGEVNLGAIPAYAPVAVAPSPWNPRPRVEVIQGPRVLANGVASIGPIARQLFLVGYTVEQALAINVEGKGVVLIVGCGHQGVCRLAERARQLFDEPVYGIIGGLHLPARGGPEHGPLKAAIGADRLPWPGLPERDVDEAIEIIGSLRPGVVAVSPHDSSNWTIGRFKAAFGEKYREIKVGRELIL